MSTPINDPGAFQQDDNSGQGESFTGNINPAWNDVLNVIPKEVHSQVLPHFSKWDQGVQERFNTVQSKYKPYDVFVENQISPDELRYSYGLYQAIQNKPLDVIRAMKETMGLDLSELIDQGQIEDPDSEAAQYAQLPPEMQQQIMQMQRQQEVMGQILLKQREEAVRIEQEKALEAELTNLRQKYGDFREEYVLYMMANGMTGEEAVQKYLQDHNINPAPRNNAPRLLGSGSAIPDQGIDPRKLNPQQTKNLIVEMLKQQRGG